MRTNANTHDTPSSAHKCLLASAGCTHSDIRHAHVIVTDDEGLSNHIEIPEYREASYEYSVPENHFKDDPNEWYLYGQDPWPKVPSPTHLNFSFELRHDQEPKYRLIKSTCDNMNSCERHAEKQRQTTGNDMTLNQVDLKIVNALEAERFRVHATELPFMLHDPYGNVVSIDFNDDAVVLNDRTSFSSDPMYVPYSMFPDPAHMAAVIRYCMRQIVLKG